MRGVLFVMLAIDCLQLVAGLGALARARRGYRVGAPSFARYSLSHGVLLGVGALLFAVPVALGLLDVVRASSAVYAALVLEVIGFLVARPAVRRFDAAHQARRPGAQLAG